MWDRMWGKGNTPLLLVGVQVGKAPLNISMDISQKLGNNLSQDPEIPLLGVYPKDVQSYHKDMCLTMFISIVCHSQNL